MCVYRVKPGQESSFSNKNQMSNDLSQQGTWLFLHGDFNLGKNESVIMRKECLLLIQMSSLNDDRSGAQIPCVSREMFTFQIISKFL